MARKRSAPTILKPTSERTESYLRTGDYAAAVGMARELYELAPTAAHLAFRKRILRTTAIAYAEAGKSFQIVMAEADALTPEDDEWAVERAGWLARAGKLNEALARARMCLAPDATRRVLGHAADRAVRLKTITSLPAELEPALQAVLDAFRHHEAADDEAARQSLQAVGLQSPFLDWKVFLRGLIAYSQQDDARAAENWQRLDPARLAARLAAPLRSHVDPAFRASLAAESAAELTHQYDTLNSGILPETLRALRHALGSDKPLSAAFRDAEKVLPQLQRLAPALKERLANCFYFAIIHHGQPDDLPRYRKLFGNPVDDPQFHRLQALVYEQIPDWPESHKHWQKYEAWLASNPPGWPPEIAARVRAIVWHRLGVNAERYARSENSLAAPLSALLGTRKTKRKDLSPPPSVCMQHASELAPDWTDPALRLFMLHRERDANANAEKVAREHLARKPGDLDMLKSLGRLLQETARFREATDIWLEALAVHSLDKKLRQRAATAITFDVRQRLATPEWADARVLLEKHRSLLEAQAPAECYGLDAVIAAKEGQADAAARSSDKALAVPDQSIASAYRMLVDATVAGLKPAQKTAGNKRFKTVLEETPTPAAVLAFLLAVDAYQRALVKYRGQKTHEKLVLEEVERCLTAEAPPADYERLGEILITKQEWKTLQILAVACAKRFPTVPFFPFAEATSLFHRQERAYHVEMKLNKARELLAASNDPQDRDLLDRTEKLARELDGPFGALEDFFRGFNG